MVPAEAPIELLGQVVPNRVEVAKDGNIFEDKTFFASVSKKFSIHFTTMFKVSGRSALTSSLRQ